MMREAEPERVRGGAPSGLGREVLYWTYNLAKTLGGTEQVHGSEPPSPSGPPAWQSVPPWPSGLVHHIGLQLSAAGAGIVFWACV